MSTPVLTLTLNPALDQTITLARLRLGEVHRAQATRIDAAGKGVNVASVLADWGVRCTVTGLLGCGNRLPFDQLFTAKGITDAFVGRPGDTRTNLKLLDVEAADTTDINLPGLVVDAGALEDVRAQLRVHCATGTVVVLAGSLPSGLPDDSYAVLAADIARLGGRAVLDTSGASLTAALAGEVKPYAAKPNRHELEAWAGRALSTQNEVIAAARDLQACGIALVAVSLGADGALFLRDGEIVRAQPLPVAVGSSVGAGDAMVAGLVAALIAAASLEGIARLATAFSAAKLGCEGANLPPRERVLALAEEVKIQRPVQEPDRRRSGAGLPSPIGRGAGGEGASSDQKTASNPQHGAQA